MSYQQYNIGSQIKGELALAPLVWETCSTDDNDAKNGIVIDRRADP